MNRHTKLLAGLLIAQVLLIGLLTVIGSDSDEAAKFLDIDRAAVTGLAISDGDGNRVTLTRKEQGWQLGDGLPADSNKISGVIDALVDGVASWPVASSGSSQVRFEVTEESHQRRLTMESKEGVLADLVFGTSPGFRRVHARNLEEDAIYSIDFAVHQLPATDAEWLDKQLLRTEGVTGVVFPGGQTLARGAEDGQWRLEGETADQDAAGKYVERIERLSVLGLADDSTARSLGDTRTVLVDDNSGRHQLNFRHDEEADEYLVESDRFPGQFTVASYLAEQILVDPAELIPSAAPDGESPSAPEQPDAGMDADVMEEQSDSG